MIIKDAMIIIHLIKLSLLEKACDYFKSVYIPKLVYKEIENGRNKGELEIEVLAELIKRDKIRVVNIKNKELIKKANNFNIFGGEAEVVALAWEKNSKMIASDDNNVRRKKILLNLEVIGTPAIIIKLYRKNKINKDKITKAIRELRKIGWFSSTIYDYMIMEVEKNE